MLIPWVIVTIIMVGVDTAAIIYECIISVSFPFGYLCNFCRGIFRRRHFFADCTFFTNIGCY